MTKKVPAYIIKHAEALEKAHMAIAKHIDAIGKWVEANGGDCCQFVDDYRLDMVYEYDMGYTIEGLKNI